MERITTSIKVGNDTWAEFKSMCAKMEYDLADALDIIIQKALREKTLEKIKHSPPLKGKIFEIYWDEGLGETSIKTMPYYEQLKNLTAAPTPVSIMDIQTDILDFAQRLSEESTNEFRNWASKVRRGKKWESH